MAKRDALPQLSAVRRVTRDWHDCGAGHWIGKSPAIVRCRSDGWQTLELPETLVRSLVKAFAAEEFHG